MSNIKISGVLGKDAEKRFLPNGDPVMQMSVSVYTGKKDGNYNPSVWVNVSCFDEQIVNNFEMYKKGTKVTVTGQPRPPRTYQKDGQEKSAGLEVTAYQIELGDTFREQQDDMSF